MKTASTALQNLIATGVFASWHLYTITLPGGGTLTLTNADFDIVDASNTTYSSGGVGSGMPKIDSSSQRVVADVKAGLDPDQWQVYIFPQVTDPFSGLMSYPDTVGGTPWLTACRAGIFDGATVKVQRAFFAAPPQQPLTKASRTPVGTTIEFVGYLGQVDASTTSTIFTFSGWGALLSQSMPRNLYQSGCRHRLFGTQCGLAASAYLKTGTALAGSTPSVMLSLIAAPGGSGTFTLGQVQFTSGQNSGFSRLVVAWGNGQFQFIYPLPFPIAAGDAFNAWPGCDKTMGSQGCAGFNNLVNFGGEPFIPLPEIQLG